MRVLDAKDVVKEFGGVKALDKVTISVDKGDFYGFFGPNGAGPISPAEIEVELVAAWCEGRARSDWARLQPAVRV